MSFKTISYSMRDTCETQMQIAAHNSVYETLSSGKPVIYEAPCMHAKKAKPAAAKTS